MESEPGTRRSAERLQISPQTHHKKSLSLLTAATLPTSPHSDLTAISDFSVPTPSVLFAKASRQTLEVRDLSPGPAYYSPSVDSSKEHHCSVAIPKGGKRYECLVPGLALYTPLRTSLARDCGNCEFAGLFEELVIAAVHRVPLSSHGRNGYW